MPSSRSDNNRKTVAVVGAGAAGLVSARELLRAGHTPTVFEEAPEIGGVWLYSEQPEDDPAGLRPTRRVHSSLYDSLRTNLPTDLMAFRDYPFDSSGGGADDWPRFPHHTCVLQYLANFARDFDLYPHIRFERPVASVERSAEGRWRVETIGGAEIFDAVMICNGHYRRPRIPSLAGIDRFRGLLMHSHNYRRPEPFAGKRVALLGGAASAFDLGREISSVAKAVYWCADAFPPFSDDGVRPGVIQRKPTPVRFSEDGALHFGDGTVAADLDAFIFCTGYHYDFPFLQAGIVNVTDDWVHPLHLDLIPVEDPTLAFIGLPFSVIPFPLLEIQARWFSRLLAGGHYLPPLEERRAEFEARARTLQTTKAKTRHFHKMAEEQFEYMNLLARQCGAAPLPEWFAPLYRAVGEARKQDPDNFREAALPGSFL